MGIGAKVLLNYIRHYRALRTNTRRNFVFRRINDCVVVSTVDNP